MIWIPWPKKASKLPTDLDENIMRDFGLKSGLVDVKASAVDEVWSGLKSSSLLSIGLQNHKRAYDLALLIHASRKTLTSIRVAGQFFVKS